MTRFLNKSDAAIAAYLADPTPVDREVGDYMPPHTGTRFGSTVEDGFGYSQARGNIGVTCDCGVFFPGFRHPEGHVEAPGWGVHIRNSPQWQDAIAQSRRTLTCSHPAHPRGEPGGRVVRRTGRSIYRHRLCGTCGKSQGLARLPAGS